jgi:hypothetical protein
MSAQALGWVIGYYALVTGSGNLGSDVHLLTPARHFANAPSPTVLCQRWRDGLHRFLEEAVAESAPAGVALHTIPHRKEALTVFGEATHSLADFYAHTNWIELAVARHVRPGLAPLLGERCVPTAFPPALQSGYSNHLTGGLSGCPRTGPPPPFRYCDAQLNKDDDKPRHHGHDKALSDGTTYFQVAVRLATQATAALWQALHDRILARYGANPTIDAPCVFHKLAWGGDASCQKRTTARRPTTERGGA